MVDSTVNVLMADAIIHTSILLFELFFFLFGPDLDYMRLPVVSSRLGGLPYSGAISLPSGLPSFDGRCFGLLQGGGVIFSS